MEFGNICSWYIFFWGNSFFVCLINFSFHVLKTLVYRCRTFLLYFFLSLFLSLEFFLPTHNRCRGLLVHLLSLTHTKFVSMTEGERGTSTCQDPAFTRDSLVPSGIRIRNPSKRAATKLGVGLRGHRDRPLQT